MKCFGNMVALVLFAALLAGCELRQLMYDQPRQKPLSGNELFADGRSARSLVEGTVPRGHLEDDDLLFRGRELGRPATVFPMKMSQAMIEEGRVKYNIFCSVCHGFVGTGDGLVVQRGFPAPPSLHSEGLRAAPVGHFFDVISNGWGRMPAYRTQIKAVDRWKIVAYLRALQLSSRATLSEVPPEAMSELREEKR